MFFSSAFRIALPKIFRMSRSANILAMNEILLFE